MGKAASKVTQAFGFGGKNALNENNGPSAPKPPQWDTAIDQLFGDAPPDENVITPPTVLDAPMRPKRRRRAPAPPPSMSRGRRRPVPASSLGRGRRPRGTVHAMRTPIVPDLPRKTAKGGVHATNGPFGVNRRPMVLPVPIIERDMPARVTLTSNFKRRPSSRRRR
jgi:hypothetical protein